MKRNYPDWLRKAASKGGKSGTGASKRRTTEQCRAAANARWDKQRKGRPRGITAPPPAICADGGRCKGTHPLICATHGCGIKLGKEKP